MIIIHVTPFHKYKIVFLPGKEKNLRLLSWVQVMVKQFHNAFKIEIWKKENDSPLEGS